MSINLSELPNKSNLLVPIEKKVDIVEENKAYTMKCVRVKNEILRKLNTKSNNGRVNIRIGFLTEDDKNTLVTDISSKGYSCSVERGLLKIS